jgi:2-octaprenyl-6-methoxyphenol hydroxylase
MDETQSDVLVVGGGPVGLAAAVLFAKAGFASTLVAPRGVAKGQETRTTALLAGSVRLMSALGAWEAAARRAAPLATMRLIDDTGRLFRAPTVAFHASEIGLDAFGWNVPNGALVEALTAVADATPGLDWVNALAETVDVGADGVSVSAGGRRVSARLAVAADGRESKLRAAAGIETVRWAYDQVAVTLNITHAAPHGNVSTEFHTPAGPFTLVPLPGDRSSLVAVCRPADADFLMSLPDAALADEIERRSHSILGRVAVASGKAAWPLSGLTPKVFGARRVALVGEAAHVIPPIGAQGLNLGFRDVAVLAEILGERRGDPGAAEILSAYDAARRTDVASRTAAVDLLNRTLLSPLVPAQMLRGFGLFLADMVPGLRRRLLAEGMHPERLLPAIMRA